MTYRQSTELLHQLNHLTARESMSETDTEFAGLSRHFSTLSSLEILEFYSARNLPVEGREQPDFFIDALQPGTVVEADPVIHRAVSLNRNIRHNHSDRTLTLVLLAKRSGRILRVVRAGFSDESEALQWLRLFRIYRNIIKLIANGNTDTLTGLLNRQGLEAELQRLSADESENFHLLLLDIDHFKAINDDHGHLIGDEVLVQFAEILSSWYYDAPFIGRFGGEEFMVIFKADDPVADAEAFKDYITEIGFPEKIALRVSGGMTRLMKNIAPIAIISNADRALYYSKETGRNRISSFEHLTDNGKLLPEDFHEGGIDFF